MTAPGLQRLNDELRQLKSSERPAIIRQIAEARVEAENVLNALSKGKQSPAWDQLTADERKQIARAESALDKAKQGDDYAAIREAISALDVATRHLAEVMAVRAVLQAIGRALRR